MRNLFVLIAALTSILVPTYASSANDNKIDEADIKLVSTKPLDSRANQLIGKERVIRPDEPDAVSEPIAQSLIHQLESWGENGKGLAESLHYCSASHAAAMSKKKSSCFDEFRGEADPGCLLKQGYGRKTVGQMLTADRFDLNGDGIDDYIISDRYYCFGLSANQSNVYFVMLSRTKDDFGLAYADWASYGLEVVVDPTSGAKVLIERAPKSYGIYSRVMHLVKGKYIPRICIFEDEHGYSRCDEK
jgi:hypothetical protein